jgi:Protein of unknown function (DUF1360)
VAHTVILALLTLGAIARLTRLLVEDTITAPLRNALHYRAGRSRAWAWLSDLLGCQWCTSIWVAAALAGAHWLWHDTTPFLYIVAGLTASHVTALAASWLDAAPPPREHIVQPLEITMRVRDDRR